MKEALSNELQLTSLGYKTVLGVLEYLYTDDIKQLEPDLGLEILQAANLFNMRSLKLLCTSAIIKGMDYESAVLVYQYAKLYSATELQHEALDTICINSNRIQKTAAFGNLTKEEQEELLKIIKDRVVVPIK